MGKARQAAACTLISLALIACGARTEPAPAAAPTPAEVESAEAGDAPPPPRMQPPPPSRVAEAVWPQTRSLARVTTSKGEFVVELYPDAAPLTVANFLQYAADGHFDRTIFHRVVGGFVIQGGGYSQYYVERPTRDPVPYEGDNGLKNYRTTVAMARTSNPNSAAAQWYVNLRDNERLDHLVNDLGARFGYTVFGRVVEGMDVVDAIGNVATGPGGPFPADAPLEPIVILRVDALTRGE